MNLADLLLSHSVMYVIDARTKKSCSDVTICKTYDLEDYLTTTIDYWTGIVSLFQFDSSVDMSSSSRCLTHKFTFDNAVHFKASDSSSLVSELRVSSTQSDRTKIKISIDFGVPNGETDSSGYYYLDVGVTYGLISRLKYVTATSCGIDVSIYEYDYYGVPTEICAVYGSLITSMTTNSGKPSELALWINGMANMTGQLRVYEIMWLGTISTVGDFADPRKLLPRLWSGQRRLNFTYYEGPTDITSHYLLPPWAIMDGAGYDRSSVLEEQIVDLQEDLTEAQADLAEIKNRVSTIFCNFITNTLTAFVPLINGIVTGVNFVSGVYTEEGLFPAETINDALEKFVNIAFDALEELFE